MAQLKVSHVTKSFEGNKILEDVSIELHDHELVGLLGISGGGKTTLFNVMSGIDNDYTGYVNYESSNHRTWPYRRLDGD